MDKNKYVLYEGPTSFFDISQNDKTRKPLNLSSFTRMRLIDSMARAYSRKYKSLLQIKINKNAKGFIWLDKASEPAAVVNVETDEKTKEKWIETLEVFPPYRGTGLSKQLLQVATRELGATNVKITNKDSVVVSIFEKSGFKIYEKKDSYILMTTKSNHDANNDDEDEDDVPEWWDEQSFTIESAMYDKEHTIPIYVILMATGTPFEKVIRACTKGAYSHACISFNKDLNPIYSFGAKTSPGQSGLGFVKQTLSDSFFKTHNVRYAIYTMFVSAKIKKIMMEKLKFFEDNANKMSYDFIGCIQYLFGQSSDYKKDSYFCSRFVMDFIRLATPIDKASSLYSPNDLVGLNCISLVDSGTNMLKDFDPKKLERNVNAVKKGNQITGVSEMGFCENVMKYMSIQDSSLIDVTIDAKRVLENQASLYQYSDYKLDSTVEDNKYFIAKILTEAAMIDTVYPTVKRRFELRNPKWNMEKTKTEIYIQRK